MGETQRWKAEIEHERWLVCLRVKSSLQWTALLSAVLHSVVVGTLLIQQVRVVSVTSLVIFVLICLTWLLTPLLFLALLFYSEVFCKMYAAWLFVRLVWLYAILIAVGIQLSSLWIPAAVTLVVILEGWLLFRFFNSILTHVTPDGSGLPSSLREWSHRLGNGAKVSPAPATITEEKEEEKQHELGDTLGGQSLDLGESSSEE